MVDGGWEGIAGVAVTVPSRLVLLVECLMVLLELGERTRVSQHLTARKQASGQSVRFHEYEGRPSTWNETGENELKYSRLTMKQIVKHGWGAQAATLTDS